MEAEEFAAGAVGLHQRLARAVAAFCGDRGLAEECAQEALVRAWERIDGGEDLASLEAWTMRVALNWCRTQLRRDGARERAVARLTSARKSGTASADTVSGGLAHDVQRAVLALPERQRQVVVLHYLEDLDVATIAEITERSVGATKNALFHARKTLAAQLSSPAEAEESS